MRQHEQRAILTGEVLVEEDSTVNQSEKIIMSDKGKVSDLLIAIITLVVVTLVLMYITGYQVLSGDRTLMNIFGEADEALSLLDRKSTRLNSSHVAISYAVFCLNNIS